ncbi:proline-rich receptor-like protein kinase PERK2 [Iris pallida]|uniref:Proline-rich receptor-like protein kinase PERK2 n=1 Tax=Iris pallida TaxID=29817 RepID=A0AAX6F4D1_IRIPA|nr:proline-rich receptor-like protein kinase PERK2 [Iris pallida]
MAPSSPPASSSRSPEPLSTSVGAAPRDQSPGEPQLRVRRLRPAPA